MKKCYEIVAKSAKIKDNEYSLTIRYDGKYQRIKVTKEQYEESDMKNSMVVLNKDNKGKFYINNILNKYSYRK